MHVMSDLVHFFEQVSRYQLCLLITAEPAGVCYDKKEALSLEKTIFCFSLCKTYIRSEKTMVVLILFMGTY